MAAIQTAEQVFTRERPKRLTLLELVNAVSEITGDDKEATAVVLHMLRTGRVKLCGNFRDAKIEDLAG